MFGRNRLGDNEDDEEEEVTESNGGAGVRKSALRAAEVDVATD